MTERLMIFIDGSNLYHSLKHHFGHTDLDIGKFCHKLQRRRQLIRIYYYNAKIGQKEEPDRYTQQQTFFATVNAVPYSELRLGRLVYNNWPHTPPYEKGIDVQLATDMITHAFKDNYDVAILVAGDNDFVGAVQAVKDNGKHIEIALFGNEGTSRQLRDAADQVITINSSFVKDCWSKRSQPQPHQQQQPPQPPEPQPQTQPEPQPPKQPPLQPEPPQQQQPKLQPEQTQQQRRPRQRRPRQRRPRQSQQQQPPVQQQPQNQNTDAG